MRIFDWSSDLCSSDLIAFAVREKIRGNGHVANVNLDWDEPGKVVRLQVDQARARALGISSAQLAQVLGGSLSGNPVSVYREGDELIEMIDRKSTRLNSSH